MKGKILSVLFGLMLVFGMLIVSCDNNVAPKNESDPPKKVILDFSKNTEADVNVALGLAEEDD
jgi:hypothetical protein